MDKTQQTDGVHYLHYRYLIVMLIAVIVVTICYFFWSEESRYSTILSLIATVTSIILSIIAIFYTFTTTGSILGLGKSIEKLKEVPENVNKSLESSLTDLRGASSIIDKVASDINKSNEELDKSLKAISDYIHTLDNKLEDTKASIVNFKKEFGTGTGAGGKTPKLDIPEIVEGLPIFAALGLFVAGVMANEYKNKVVDLRKIFALDNKEFPSLGTTYYCYGIFSVFNLLSLTKCNYTSPRLKCSFIDKKLFDEIIESLKNTDKFPEGVEKKFRQLIKKCIIEMSDQEEK